MNKEMFCVKCKKRTPTTDQEVVKSKNGRYRLIGRCTICNTMKSKFISNQHANGLLSGLLGFKDGFPFLNKIPILGQLL